MKRLFVFTVILFLAAVPFISFAHADVTTQTAINNGINYLGTQLNGATGQITKGSTSDASPWAAIAFSSNGINPSTVKTSTGAPSLIDYLQHNPPTLSSSATDWEKWILALTASGQNPYTFGGINYVTTLESLTYYHDSQLGDTTSVNDDWFGVLALISSGVPSSDAVLVNSLTFVTSHQNTDGGYGYSTTADSDGNDTAAAIQALVAAKNYGVSISGVNLDDVITKAKTYLLSTIDTSGGFLYDTNPWTTSPDSDSTTWGLMALNVLGLGTSAQGNAAKQWLLSQQSNDGGFQACQYNPPDYVCTLSSNSTTTSHALIGLAGKGWLVKIFDASSQNPAPSVTPTPTINQTPTPTLVQPIPTPTVVYVTTTNTITNTVYTTPTPQVIYTTVEKYLTVKPTPTPEVLGTNIKVPENQTLVKDSKSGISFSSIFLGMGIAFLGFYGVQIGSKVFKKN